MSVTEEVARSYLDGWARADLDAIRRLLADDVAVECNAGLPADPVALCEALETVTVISQTYADDRAVLLYDCVTREPRGTIRTVEFLAVATDARITEIRRVYDLVAMRRLLPGLALPHA
jgi:hypothetical protein